MQNEGIIIDQVSYNEETKEITIIYPNYESSDNRRRSDLFDFLGDEDIVIANEIHPDAIVMSGDVYFLSNEDEGVLHQTGEVTLSFHSTLEDYCDSNDPFLKWYYNN